jgi:hypothetical protein
MTNMLLKCVKLGANNLAFPLILLLILQQNKQVNNQTIIINN